MRFRWVGCYEFGKDALGTLEGESVLFLGGDTVICCLLLSYYFLISPMNLMIYWSQSDRKKMF